MGTTISTAADHAVHFAQFDPLGNRMRARRKQIEYASSENPAVTEEEVLGDLGKAESLIALADKVLPQLDEF